MSKNSPTISVLYDLLNIGTSGEWKKDGTIVLNRPLSGGVADKIKFRSFSAALKSNIQNIIQPQLECNLCCNIEILNETSTEPANITTDELSSLPKQLVTTFDQNPTCTLSLLNQTGLKTFNNLYDNVLRLATYNIPLNNSIEDSIENGLQRAKIELAKLLGLITQERDPENYDYTSFRNGPLPTAPYKIPYIIPTTCSMFLSNNIETSGIAGGQYYLSPMTLQTNPIYNINGTSSSYPFNYSTQATGKYNIIYGIAVNGSTPFSIGYIGEETMTNEYGLPREFYIQQGGQNFANALHLTKASEYSEWLRLGITSKEYNRTLLSYGFPIQDVLPKYSVLCLLYRGFEQITDWLELRRVGYIIDNIDKYLFCCFCLEHSSDVDNLRYENHTEWLKTVLGDFNRNEYLLNIIMTNENNTYAGIITYSNGTINYVGYKQPSPSEYGKIDDTNGTSVFNTGYTIVTGFNIRDLTEEEYYRTMSPYAAYNRMILYNIPIKKCVIGFAKNSGLLDSYVLHDSSVVSYTSMLYDGTINMVEYANNEYTAYFIINNSKSSWSKTEIITNDQFKALFAKYDLDDDINPLKTPVKCYYTDKLIFIAKPDSDEYYALTNDSSVPTPGANTIYTLSNSMLMVNDWSTNGTLTPYLPTINAYGSNTGYHWINSSHITPNTGGSSMQYIYYKAEEGQSFIDNIFKWDRDANTITFPNVPLYGQGTDGKTLYGNLFFYITFNTSPDVISFDPNIKQGLLKDCSNYYSVYKQVLNKDPSLYLQTYSFDNYFYINDADYYKILNTYLLLRSTDQTLKLYSPSFPTLNNIVFYLNETSMIDFKEAQCSPTIPNIQCTILDINGQILTPEDAKIIYSNITICVDWQFL